MNRPINFSENLKYYRIKHNLTQRQLAQHIGYTEKSVSKWESGNGIPTMETILKLADLFKISLDELVLEKTSFNYFLGIDGGGTKTIFKLVDENGLVLNKIQKGSGNPNDIGMENTMALLKEGINEVCSGIPYSQISMFAGLSGGGLTGNNAEILKVFFSKFGFMVFENGSDIENIVALADCEKCVLTIMGTGFIVYALNGKERKRISGWGRLFDDGGSGYTLGRDAISAVLDALDGSGEQTLITEMLEQRVGENAAQHLTKFYQGGKKYIAEFANLVFEAAQQGDKIASDILENNMKFVAGKINAAVNELKDPKDSQVIPVMISGGISEKKEVIFPLIEKYLSGTDTRLIKIEGEPVDGALICAKKAYLQKIKGVKQI